jgi:hypothetical protein
MQPDGVMQPAAEVLAALQAASGTVGETNVTAGVFVGKRGKRGKPWLLNDNVIEGSRVFTRLSCMSRGLANFVGADLKKPHPLEQNQFLRTLTEERNNVVTKFMNKAQADTQDYEVKMIRKEAIDDVDRIVDVPIPGFHNEDGFVGGQILKMLSTSGVLECPYVEVTPASMEFVRLGIEATLNAPVECNRKRAATSDASGTFPAARVSKHRGFIYCRYRTTEGRRVQKSFGVKHSDVDEILAERRVEAQTLAQQYYDAHHVPKPLGAGSDPHSDASNGNASGVDDDNDAV